MQVADLLAQAEQGRGNFRGAKQYHAIPLCEWSVSSLAMKLIKKQRDLIKVKKVIHPQGVSLGTLGVEMLVKLGLKVLPLN